MRSGSRWCAVALALAGCAPGPDPVGAPVAWWHSLEGGAIAEQRPPPPGVDDPYPHVGTTPARPAVPSVAARDALTQSLLVQRYASTLTDARDPIAPATAVAGKGAPVPAGTAATAVPAGAAATTPAPSNGAATSGSSGGTAATAAASSASATLAAAGDGPPPAPGQKPPPPPVLLTPEQQEAHEPVLAMPPPPPGTVVLTANAPLPTMPRLPPPAPSFPNFVIPATVIAPLRPQFGAPAPANLAFTPGSDVLGPKDRGALVHAASTRGNGSVRVTGFGDALSDAPADQAAALRLGVARAAVAARTLEGLGVPRRAIRIAAAAFGRGGDVQVIP